MPLPYTQLMLDGSTPHNRELNQKNLIQKWTKPVYEKGWTALPMPLLDLPALGLRPLTFAVLVQLVSFWWLPAKKPFPSRTTLARRLGVSVRTVQRAIDELDELGLIQRLRRKRRDGGHASTEYDLSGLVERLGQVAAAATAATASFSANDFLENERLRAKRLPMRHASLTSTSAHSCERCAHARKWGRRGWPIEEVAEQLNLRLAGLPSCVWKEHELGMGEYLDQCPECGVASCPAYASGDDPASFPANDFLEDE